MSGFVGILKLDHTPVDRVLLEQMTRFLSFRGPARQEWWSEGSIGFGHALLHTTQESKSEHPPCSLDGQVWITGDVRLDGRRQLIGQLRAQASRVSETAPDVELILHAYAVWQTDCVQHLIGDFAFALWDGRVRELFCARDPFGVVPFYYAQVKNTLLVSNTLDCIRLHPGVSNELNEQAIADWLLFRSNQDPSTTTFRAIRRLPPAHTLTVAEGAVRCRRYWALPAQIEVQYRSPAETVAEFQDLFTQAVQDRLRAERVVVPMSGGLDSSSVAVTAQRLLGEKHQKTVLQTYTLTADHLVADQEGYYAGLVAAHAELPIHYVQYTVADAVEFENGAYVPPEPGFLPHARQPEIAQDGDASRVMLTGIGGDPILYPSRTFLWELVQRRQLVNFARAMAQQRRINGALPPLYVRSSLKRRARGRTLPLPRWLNPAFAARLDLATRWREVNERIETQDPRRSMAESPFWSNFFSVCDPGYSYKPMKLGFPFFDVRLVSFALTVPPVPWFVNKTLLRAAMRGALPEAVRRRPKTPLRGDPTYQQAQTQPFAWMSELASTPELEPYVDRAALLQIVSAPAQATRHEFSSARTPLALAYWLRQQAAAPKNSAG